MTFFHENYAIMAVNFIRIYVNPARMNVKHVRMNVNYIRIFVIKASKNVKKTKKKDNQIRINDNVERKHVNFIFVSDNLPILTDKKDPQTNILLQAHFAGAKRQPHLQKELVPSALNSSTSIIHQQKTPHPKNKTRDMAATNIAKKQAGLSSFSISLSLLIFWFFIQTDYL
jgi:hypothetical protein